ncbi:hypothetical protein DINM_006127 [Dirofilaria immitis]|nr:hypothetical protein [Dirofilaria immitis]
MRRNRPLSINYVELRDTSNETPSIIFYGSNVEASTFLVKAKDEKELGEKTYGLGFLKSHYIIAFHFMENETLATNGNIFREIFDIELLPMHIPTECGNVIGLAHRNSTLNSLNDGEMFSTIGFKKF